MIIDTTKKITDLKDQDIIIEGVPLTLDTVLVNSLLSTLDEDKNLPGTEKFKLFQLAMKISDASEVDLSAEEISTIKDRVAKSYTTLVVGKVWNMIDPSKT